MFPNCMHMKRGRNPLHIAVERGQARAVDRLLEWLGNGGDRASATGGGRDRVLLARTTDGDTLAHLAARHGHPAAVLSFARHGVPLFMPNKVLASTLQ